MMKYKLLTICMIILFIIVCFSGCIENLFSDDLGRFKVTVINTFNEKMEIEIYIFKKNNDTKPYFHVYFCSIEQDEGHVFDFKYNKEDGIDEIIVSATNYTYYWNRSLHPKGIASDGSEFSFKITNMDKKYIFPDGKIQNLLVAITPPIIEESDEYRDSRVNLSQINIVIMPMPETKFIQKIKF